MRIKLVVAYDGTDFRGWAAQTGRRTVRGTLTEAVRLISGEEIEIWGASRTDSGAHALGQVCHFDTEVGIPPEKWAKVLTRRLPTDLTVVSSAAVGGDFSARFMAKDRFYRYRILTGAPDPFRGRFVHAYGRGLDVDAMQRAANGLLGRNDFLAFTEELEPHVANTVRELYSLRVSRRRDEVWVDVVGTAFLRGNDAKDGGRAPRSRARGPPRRRGQQAPHEGGAGNLEVAGGAARKRLVPHAGALRPPPRGLASAKRLCVTRQPAVGLWFLENRIQQPQTNNREMNNRTTSYKPGDIEQKWYVVDASGNPRRSPRRAGVPGAPGKNKPNFVYNADCGDFVIVINADKAVLTGGKADEVIYWHTGWPGGLKNVARGKMLEEKPEMLIEKAVWGMMPKTKLGKAMVKKLKVYAGADHPHEAQTPEALDVRKDKK